MKMRTMKWSKWIVLTTMVFLLTFLFGMTALAAPQAPTGLTQTKYNANAVEIQWNAVSGTNIRYQLDYSQNNTSWNTYRTNISDVSAQITGLSTGQTYYFRVRAYQSGSTDYSGYSSSLAATTSPGTISKIQQTKAAKSSVTLQWSAASGATGYQVWYYDGQNGRALSLAKNTNTTSVTISGLKSSQKYAFMVYPERKVGNFTALNSGYGMYVSLLPGKVSNFKLAGTDLKNKNLYLQWKPSPSISGYEIDIYNKNNKKIKTYKSYNSDSSGNYFATIKKLKRSMFYKARIRGYAKLSSGKKYGKANEIYIAKQPKMKKSPYVQSSNSLNLNWEKTAGASGYTIYAGTSYNKLKKLATTKKTSYNISKINKKKLTTYKYYYFNVVPFKKAKGKTYYGDKSSYNRFYIQVKYN